MPVHQSGKNVLVAYKAQSGLGTAASGAGALGLNIAPSPGLRLTKAIVNDPTVRRDGQTLRGRHGSRQAAGSYNVPVRVGELDTLIAAMLRTTATAALSITEAAMTSITTTTNTIVAAGGSWLTQGVRRGDLVKLTNHSTAANNGKWFRVLSVSATTITVPAASLTTDAAPDSAFTLTVAKTIISGATPTETYFTFEEYNQDIDISMQFTDVKVSRLKFSAKPNEIVMCEVGLVGLDGQPLATGSSPTFSSPTFVSNALGLELASGKIAINGTDYADLTAFELEIDAAAQVPGVLAPNAPDVFMGNAVVKGSVAGIRVDGAQFNAFDNETQVEFFVHMKEPEADPSDFVSIYVGNSAYVGNDGPIGSDGPLVETIPFISGKDEGGSDRAATTVKFSTSAA